MNDNIPSPTTIKARLIETGLSNLSSDLWSHTDTARVLALLTSASKEHREAGKHEVRNLVSEGRMKIAADELTRLAADRANHFEP